MMKLTLLFPLVLLATNVTAQVEHAPTVAQCQADQRLWLSRLENNNDALPPWSVMSDWALEMNGCVQVDPQNDARYYNTYYEIAVNLKLRLKHFLDRQNLFAQFLKEDSEGKR